MQHAAPSRPLPCTLYIPTLPTHFSEEAATRQALMGDSLASGSLRVRGLSGIHTVKAAWGTRQPGGGKVGLTWPENVPYLTLTSALRAPRVSDPSM